MNKETQLEFPFMDEIKMVEAKRDARCQAKSYLDDGNTVYWFPHEQGVRLLIISDDYMPTRESHLIPFYFKNVGICMCLPNEKDSKKPPEEWGIWSDAILLEKPHEQQ